MPRGDPPAGRQIVADRRSLLGALVPSNGDGVVRVFVYRPGATPDTMDLTVVSVDPNGGPPSEKLLVSNADAVTGLGCVDFVAPCTMVRRSGKALVYTKNLDLVWVDPFTGDTRYIGQPFWGVPTDEGRYFVSNQNFGGPAAPLGGTLYEPDGRATVLDDVD